MKFNEKINFCFEDGEVRLFLKNLLNMEKKKTISNCL